MSKGLILNQLGVWAGEKPLVHPVSLNVQPGQCAVIQGPSGSGKSSLLLAVAGLLGQGLTSTGQVQVDGQALETLPPSERCLGLLFQRPTLFPHLSVGQNIALVMTKKKSKPESRQARLTRVRDWLRSVDLTGFENRDPASLSGGQAARVALVRMLATAPKAALLDEPFSALDQELRASIRQLTFQHLAKAGVPTILVTHDENDVPQTQLTPKLYQMRDGQMIES